jgi:hypothetical protein
VAASTDGRSQRSASTLLLAVVVILADFPDAGNALLRSVGLPTLGPTPTLAPNADFILLAKTVPWGWYAWTAARHPTEVLPSLTSPHG